MSIRSLLAFTVLLAASVASAGDAWIQFRSRDGGYSVQFPARPNVQTKYIKLKNGETLPAEMAIVEHQRKAYCAVAIDGSKYGTFEGYEDALLDMGLKEIDGKRGLKTLAVSPFKIGTGRGRQVLMGNETIEMQVYAVVRGSKAMLIGFAGAPGTSNSSQAVKFIRSFRLSQN